MYYYYYWTGLPFVLTGSWVVASVSGLAELCFGNIPSNKRIASVYFYYFMTKRLFIASLFGIAYPVTIPLLSISSIYSYYYMLSHEYRYGNDNRSIYASVPQVEDMVTPVEKTNAEVAKEHNVGLTLDNVEVTDMEPEVKEVQTNIGE